MGPVNSPGSSFPIYEQVEDAAELHQNINFNRNEEDEYPSRPSSRLGFNRPKLSTCAPTAPDSEAVQWSRSLFQNVGISDLRISSLKNRSARNEDMLDECPTDNDMCSPSNEVPPEAQPTTGSDNCIPPPIRKVPSVSRLCFPFVTTPSPRRNKPPPAPPPPPRHKYSCFPSLMSPAGAGRPYPKHQRHNYRQHGYSRAALQHVKWFWSMREEEWEPSDTQVDNNKVYEGFYQDFDNIRPRRRAVPIPPIHYDPPPTAVLPMTVHPRRGDISALRDPYCMHIDRCFVGLPTWTISKTLWMYDVHMAAKYRKNASQDACDEEDSSDGESENDLETSGSTNFSDDSDTTLVESEGESDFPDVPQSGSSTADKNSKDEASVEEEFQEKFGGQSSAFVFANRPSPKHPHGQLDISKASWSPHLGTLVSKQRPRHFGSNRTPWATNWYRRWELLVDLSRHDKGRPQAPDETKSLLKISPLPNDIGHGFFEGPSDIRNGNDDRNGNDEWDAQLESIET